MNQISDFNPYRPKVSLRRFTDPKIRLAIKEYILNRHTAAGIVSLAFVMSLVGCTGDNIPYDPCATDPHLRPAGIKCP